MVAEVACTTHTESEKGNDSQCKGDDRLRDDIPLVLVLAWILVGIAAMFENPHGVHCEGHRLLRGRIAENIVDIVAAPLYGFQLKRILSAMTRERDS